MSVNPVGWFEIPVKKMNRAIQFYNAVFDLNLEQQKFDELIMAWFPSDQNYGAGGSLVYHSDFYEPSEHAGVVIYISCGDVADTCQKVLKSGGTVLVDKKLISPDHGYMGIMIDSEGNRIGLHSVT